MPNAEPQAKHPGKRDPTKKKKLNPAHAPCPCLRQPSLAVAVCLQLLVSCPQPAELLHPGPASQTINAGRQLATTVGLSRSTSARSLPPTLQTCGSPFTLWSLDPLLELIRTGTTEVCLRQQSFLSCRRTGRNVVGTRETATPSLTTKASILGYVFGAVRYTQQTRSVVAQRRRTDQNGLRGAIVLGREISILLLFDPETQGLSTGLSCNPFLRSAYGFAMRQSTCARHIGNNR